PILTADVKKLTGCNVFFFIPVSDYEISLETLRFLKENSDGTIIFDAHGPTTACLINGERMRKFWIDRDQWLPYIDVLKMNLEEAYASWFKKEYETRDLAKSHEEANFDELRAFATHCTQMGVRAEYITLDIRGCMV